MYPDPLGEEADINHNIGYRIILIRHSKVLQSTLYRVRARGIEC
ncbi:unnamed protein product [Fusarium graminearum]|uniref:Chromosome 2, complete genome n=1 Tax=Gibberella zeae (strain ATCC MYA-4620 / CBS 123657 / FGSC 9075 / NRRL 31084 / PH-1) TaxID=229533 RepID=A0A098DF84_GIBZE|nr:unnamed protein product [Fusarium graminearum]CZS80914.1 unnamed protein product [Fusarium graminearum]